MERRTKSLAHQSTPHVNPKQYHAEMPEIVKNLALKLEGTETDPIQPRTFTFNFFSFWHRFPSAKSWDGWGV